MPLIQLQTNRTVEDKEALCKALSAKTAELLSKPESYVMVAVQDGVAMMFGGTSEPTAFFSVASLGTISGEQAARFSAEVSAILQEQLGVAKGRVYSSYTGWKERELWGFDGRTF
jgi:phenylpyruvate tautomerase